MAGSIRPAFPIRFSISASNVLLELSRLAGFRRPVAGIVDARGKLIGDQVAIGHDEEFERQNANMAERVDQRDGLAPCFHLNFVRQT